MNAAREVGASEPHGADRVSDRPKKSVRGRTAAGKRIDATDATDATDAERAEIRARLDFAMMSAVPLDGTLDADRALKGLDRIEAWARWARAALAVDLAPSPNDERDGIDVKRVLVRTIGRVNGAIDQVRGNQHADVDVRNGVIADILARAEAFTPFAPEMVLRSTIRSTRDISPTLADRLEADRLGVLAALGALAKGHRPKAIGVLSRILGAPKSTNKDAGREYDAWTSKRRERLR